MAPVLEKGATSRRVYLPRGFWHDFWTGEVVKGGAEVSRPVDLETIPLYVRAGAILTLGPIKQYAAEQVDQPVSLLLHPGADGSFLYYEDDGISFQHRSGDSMRIEFTWRDSARSLSLRLASGSHLRPPAPRTFDVRLGRVARSIAFDGKPVDISL